MFRKKMRKTVDYLTSGDMINPIHLKGKLKFFFISLLFLLFLYPYLEGSGLESTILNIAFSIVLLTGVYAISYDRMHLVTGVFLAVPALVTNWLNYPSEHIMIAHVFAIMFYFYAIISILTYIMKAVHITSDVLFGAISVYIIIGITFGVLFSLISIAYPGSFTAGENSWSDLVYFSFSTLTTVGYGDIVPITTLARSLSVIEMVTGQMFITIILAKIVGIYIFQTMSEK
ncbi:MAG: potassium channel family protein [archaeon]